MTFLLDWAGQDKVYHIGLNQFCFTQVPLLAISFLIYQQTSLASWGSYTLHLITITFKYFCLGEPSTKRHGHENLWGRKIINLKIVLFGEVGWEINGSVSNTEQCYSPA